MDRLAMLESMIEKCPEDPFPRYGRALELQKLERLEDAQTAFDSLIAGHPQYLPSYLMAGTLLQRMGRADEAAKVLGQGMDVARAAKDAHTLGELEDALAGLG